MKKKEPSLFHCDKNVIFLSWQNVIAYDVPTLRFEQEKTDREYAHFHGYSNCTCPCTISDSNKKMSCPFIPFSTTAQIRGQLFWQYNFHNVGRPPVS